MGFAEEGNVIALIQQHIAQRGQIRIELNLRIENRVLDITQQQANFMLRWKFAREERCACRGAHRRVGEGILK